MFPKLPFPTESEIDENELEVIACRLIEEVRTNPLDYRSITTVKNDPDGKDFQKYVNNRANMLKFVAAVGIKTATFVAR